MDERAKRLALNEAMFREINERLESRIRTFTDEGEAPLIVLCECADPDCNQRLSLTPDEYHAVRADSRQFVLSPGHERLEIEDVIISTDRYQVVRKKGDAGAIAEKLEGHIPPGTQEPPDER